MTIGVDKNSYQVAKNDGNKYIYLYEEATLEELMKTKLHCMEYNECEFVDINLTDYNVIEVSKFTELLDVRDNLKMPINYYNIAKHEKGIFYIKNNDDIYLLTLKNVDLKGKKLKELY